MSIQLFPDPARAPRGNHCREVIANVSSQVSMQLPTPLGSNSGNPGVKIEGKSLMINGEFFQPTKTTGIYSEPQEVTTLPEPHRLKSPHDGSPMRLPGLGELDEGVKALIQKHGPAGSWTPSSPLSGLSGNPTAPQPLKSLNLSEPTQSFREFPSENSATDGYASRRGTITNSYRYTLAIDHARQLLQSNYRSLSDYNSRHGKAACAIVASNQPLQRQMNRHINQKYTTEEGDFIIYAWHDKKMKWQEIKKEFAARFHPTPERTVQGLQGWYYRMNLRIPICDKDGRLCFGKEDDLEPRHVSIKCRGKDSQDKPVQALGLAERYPERAVNYAWVDPELKLKARDWAEKRALQYQERRRKRQIIQ